MVIRTMIDVPSMVISDDELRPPEIQGVEPPPGTTPGTSVARLNGLRPLRGRSMMAALPMTVDTVEEVT